jgi:hypothetical protein
LTTGRALTAIAELFIDAGLLLSPGTIIAGAWLARATEGSG